MKKAILAVLLISTVFLVSCNTVFSTYTTYHNNSIDATVRNDIRILDRLVLDSLKNNDFEAIREIFSKGLLEKESDFQKMMESVSDYTKDKFFNLIDKYYGKGPIRGKEKAHIAPKKFDPYFLTIPIQNKETFISLYRTNSGIEDRMVFIEYIKEKRVWKLNSLFIDGYSYRDMTAADLTAEAKIIELRAFELPTILYMKLCSRVEKPAPYIQYFDINEITKFSSKIFRTYEINYAYPIKLDTVEAVEIYEFDIIATENGFSPIIRYKTGKDINDAEDILKEAKEIHKEIIDTYRGMDIVFVDFIYEAYNEPPVDSRKEYKFQQSDISIYPSWLY